MATISRHLEVATQHGPLNANLIILGLLVTLAFLWLTSSTVIFFLLGDDWKLGIDSPKLRVRGRAKINGPGPSLCNMDQDREETVREMVQHAKIIAQQARKPRRKTVAEMVEEQKTLRGKTITELIPISQGLGGKRDMWKEYYAWMDVMEVIDEEEETEEQEAEEAGWRRETMDLKIVVDRS
ncbi:hypothetical protein QBC43DRAFT_292290 [Cladorrhinum sp. PSN259]|nr:hypothetical protein QBC43DRAFT_292290 [Cladorrhinum sp. PSN259]